MRTLSFAQNCFTESAKADYGATGFHHRHTAVVGQIPSIVKSFVEAGYLLEMLTCQDRRESEGEMRLCYTFNRYSAYKEGAPDTGCDRHLLHVGIDPEVQEAPSVVDLIPAANWFEREVFDMYGVRFANHPYLVRILLPEDADFFALRRDFGRIDEADDENEDEEDDDA